MVWRSIVSVSKPDGVEESKQPAPPRASLVSHWLPLLRDSDPTVVGMDATLYLIMVDHAVQETLLHSRIPCNLILGLILIALVELLYQFRRHFLKGVHLCLWEERSGWGLKAWLRMRGGFYRADPGGAVGGGATHAQIICKWWRG